MDFFIGTWRSSLAADIVFVLGSGAVFAGVWLGLAAVRRRNPKWVLGAGFLLAVASYVANWLVYWVSFLILRDSRPRDPLDPTLEYDLLDALVFVHGWGFLGLGATALMTLGAMGYWLTRQHVPTQARAYVEQPPVATRPGEHPLVRRR